jgi:hypothetical protein
MLRAAGINEGLARRGDEIAHHNAIASIGTGDWLDPGCHASSKYTQQILEKRCAPTTWMRFLGQ